MKGVTICFSIIKIYHFDPHVRRQCLLSHQCTLRKLVIMLTSQTSLALQCIMSYTCTRAYERNAPTVAYTG
jgi:hypothetical protein